MTKILLVEDDKSLREIYGVRLMAEGYQITSAGDGEEALAMAVKEKPDLIISDVMMPKISGFDMLDILRSTPETKDVQVIMMTALSSEDQRARGESLGANKYLVKSQVGIEDVVRAVHEILGDSPAANKPAQNEFAIPAPTAAIIPEPVASAIPSEPDFQPEEILSNEIVSQEIPESPVTPEPSYENTTPVEQPVSSPIQEQQSVVETPVVMPQPQPAQTYNQSFNIPQRQDTPTQTGINTVVERPQPATVPQFTRPVEAPAQPVQAQQSAPAFELPQPTAPFSSPAPSSMINPGVNLSPIEQTNAPQDISSLIDQELQNINNQSN